MYVHHENRTEVLRPPTMTGSGTENDEKKRFAPWIRSATKPTNQQERTMITEALNIGLNTVMKQHIYIHNNEIRLQQNGGAIGLELTGALAETGALAQAMMVWWDKQFISKAADLQLTHHMYKRYVDDVNVCVTALPEGATLNENNNAIIMPDNTDTLSDKTTMEILQKLANNIHPSKWKLTTHRITRTTSFQYST